MRYFPASLLCVWLCFWASLTCQAQNNPELSIQGISFETIKEQVTDKEGVYYYPDLLKRFQINDASLKSIDYLMLYYGFVTQEDYNPYKTLALEDSLPKLTSARKGQEAIAWAEQILSKTPISLAAYVEKAYALRGINQESLSMVELGKYSQLLQTIMRSGEGSSYEKPLIVISPKDEEIVLLAHKLTVLSKSMNGNSGRFYDVYLVRNEKGKQYPLYFDITLPYTIGMKKLSEK